MRNKLKINKFFPKTNRAGFMFRPGAEILKDLIELCYENKMNPKDLLCFLIYEEKGRLEARRKEAAKKRKELSDEQKASKRTKAGKSKATKNNK